MRTVDREFDQSVRYARQMASGGSFVANLTLRLAPEQSVSGVLFASALTDSDAAKSVPSVEGGVRQFVTRQSAEGVLIGHLRVTLIEMPIHPVDASPRHFREAAEMAMAEAFKRHGTDD